MTTVTIKTIAETSGRDGPQWELKVTWPWTVAHNVDTVWLDQKQFSKPALGAQQVVVARKSRKKNRDKVEYDGLLDWMWNWNIIEFGSDGLLPPNPTSGSDNSPEVQPDPWESSLEPDYEAPTPRPYPQEPPPNPAALGACQNHAMAFIESGIIPIPDGRDPLNFLQELRDRVYRNVNQTPYQPDPHFCYPHQQPRVQGKSGAWGHRDGDGWCMEDNTQEADHAN